MKHQENKIDLTLSLSLFFWKEILVSLNSNESSNECIFFSSRRKVMGLCTFTHNRPLPSFKNPPFQITLGAQPFL